MLRLLRLRFIWVDCFFDVECFDFLVEVGVLLCG